MLSDRCLSACPVCNVGVLWPNGWTDQHATWYGGRPRPKRHCVRWGLSFPPQKGGRAPQISAHVCCGQTAAWIKMALGIEVGLGPGHTVLDGDPAPLLKRGHSPPFSVHVYCAKTAGWIKMPLGTMLGLGPGNILC